MKILYSQHYPNVAYDVQHGVFYRLKPATQAIVRALAPDEQGMLSVVDGLTKKHTFKKAVILAWEFIHSSKLPDGYVVYFKNLNTADYNGYNIAAIPRAQFALLRDAIDNISGVLKLVPHATEVYSYKVRYKHKGQVLHKQFHDVVDAQKFMRSVLIKSTKIMSRHLVDK